MLLLEPKPAHTNTLVLNQNKKRQQSYIDRSWLGENKL